MTAPDEQEIQAGDRLAGKPNAGGDDRAEGSATGHVWMFGTAANVNITEHLRQVVATAANAALDRFSPESPEESLFAAVSAGLALEAALKLSIARQNPVLIADMKRGTSAAVAIEVSRRRVVKTSELKTLSGMDALTAFRQLHGEVKGLPSLHLCQELFDTRNGAAHMGIVEHDKLRRSVGTMVAAIEAIQEFEGLDVGEFWRTENIQVVETLLDEAASEAERSLAEKKASAARTFAQLSDRIPFEQAGDFFASIENRLRLRESDDMVLRRCPVCERWGALHLYIAEEDFDFTGHSYGQDEPSGYRYAYPELFECAVCGLQLDESEIDQEPRFEDDRELELDPSEDFERALSDWRYEQEAERRRDELRTEWDRWG